MTIHHTTNDQTMLSDDSMLLAFSKYSGRCLGFVTCIKDRQYRDLPMATESWLLRDVYIFNGTYLTCFAGDKVNLEYHTIGFTPLAKPLPSWQEWIKSKLNFLVERLCHE